MSQTTANTSTYFDGLNLKLCNQIPSTAKRVLELGCANGRLGRYFKETHPNVIWWGIERSETAAKIAAGFLDNVLSLDLDNTDLTKLEGHFDTFVIGDLLEHLLHPERTLDALYKLASTNAKIICCLPNMAHISVIERMVAGDISYDAMGLLDSTHVRFYSQASAFKTFLDAGWLPTLADQYQVGTQNAEFAQKIVEAAKTIGVPQETALRNLGCYQMIITCIKSDGLRPLSQNQESTISVIVPVNRPWQYELNIARSPGLQEINAEIIPVQGAESAAQAYASGCVHANHAWRLLVHQDVYFPKGSGLMLERKLRELSNGGNTGGAVGFAGLAVNATGEGDGIAHFAGMVIDRINLFSHPSADNAASVDEFAVALHRDTLVSIDHRLGWHLWATDLCLQSQVADIATQRVHIIRVPLFHNSTTPFQLPEAFQESARILLNKYAGLRKIHTRCGVLARAE